MVLELNLARKLGELKPFKNIVFYFQRLKNEYSSLLKKCLWPGSVSIALSRVRINEMDPKH